MLSVAHRCSNRDYDREQGGRTLTPCVSAEWTTILAHVENSTPLTPVRGNSSALVDALVTYVATKFQLP